MHHVPRQSKMNTGLFGLLGFVKLNTHQLANSVGFFTTLAALRSQQLTRELPQAWI